MPLLVKGGCDGDRVLPTLVPKPENHSNVQPSCHNYFLPFVVKKQFSKVGLSPKPPDPLTPGPVLTPQRGTSRCCWFPCRPPLLVLTGFMAAARIWAALGGGTGLFLTATTILCPSQIGLGTWAGCRSLMKGSFFCHLIAAPTLCCYISHLPHRPVVIHFLVNLRKNCECGCEEMNGLMDCPFITVLVYSNFCFFFFHLKFLSKACL